MRKIFIIETCRQCPNFHAENILYSNVKNNQMLLCKLSNRQLDSFVIPEWCLLKDAE